jgi:hypothetical protein
MCSRRKVAVTIAIRQVVTHEVAPYRASHLGRYIAHASARLTDSKGIFCDARLSIGPASSLGDGNPGRARGDQHPLLWSRDHPVVDSSSRKTIKSGWLFRVEQRKRLGVIGSEPKASASISLNIHQPDRVASLSISNIYPLGELNQMREFRI